MKGMKPEEFNKMQKKMSEAIMNDVPRKIYEMNIKKKAVKSIAS